MIVVGVDAHKQVHVAVALDDAGREIAEWRGPNHAVGWRSLSQWADELPGPKVWGIEGAWSYGRGLAQALVAEGATVYEVNARWTALGRRSARKRDKSDRLDARAVARFVRQEAPSLPAVAQEDDTTVLDLLTTERGSRPGRSHAASQPAARSPTPDRSRIQETLLKPAVAGGARRS